MTTEHTASEQMPPEQTEIEQIAHKQMEIEQATDLTSPEPTTTEHVTIEPTPTTTELTTTEQETIDQAAKELATTTAVVDNFSQKITGGNMKHAMSDAKAGRRDMWFVPVNRLTILDGFNVRSKNEKYKVDVRLIADSIKANGFYSHKPFAVIIILVGGKETIAIYDGHTRYDALQLAISEGHPIETVPCIAAAQGTSMEDITIGLITNNNGRNLEPLALATVCKRLVGYGLDNATIAKRLGFTPPYVGGLLQLIGGQKEIRDMVDSGVVSASLAVTTMRDHGERAVEVLEVGLVAAKKIGKTKVTARVLPPKIDKPDKKSKNGSIKEPTKGSTSVTPKLTPLESGLEWINDNGQMEHSYALLAAITGLTIPALKKIQL